MIPHRLVWIACAGERAVGLTMLEPRKLRWDDEDWVAGYWTDLYIDPAYRSTKLYPRLASAMFNGAREAGMSFVYAAVRRPEVARAHLAIGMSKAGELPVLAKPLLPVSLLAKYKRLPRAVSMLGAGLDAAYAAFLRRRRRLRPALPVQALPWTRSNVEQWLELRRSSAGSRLHQAWTSGLLLRRLEEDPDGMPYLLFGARANGRLAAAAVSRLVHRRSAIRTEVIMETAHRENELAALRACLLEIERRASEQDAEVILSLPTQDAMTNRALRALGYRESPERYILMYRMTSRTPARRPAQDLSQWHYAFLDHDAF
ncbi:MAG: hypothetical protein AAB225_02675 [Acidobacteriota bacterium]